MKTKHPAFYILVSLFLVLGTFSAAQIVLRCYQEPLFWHFLITLLSATMVILIVNLLIYTRKISPRMKLLPPPLQ